MDPATKVTWWKWEVAKVVLSSILVGIVIAIAAVAVPTPQFEWPIASRQLQSSSFEYKNDNDTYSPSSFVEYGHMITGQDFEANMDYIQRVLYAPIVTFGLGLLSFIFFFFGMLSRCCCECSKCIPDVKDQKYEQHRFYHTLVYYALLLLVMIFDQLVFLGNTSIDSGVKTIDDTLLGVQDVFQAIDDDSVTLLAYGDDLNSQYDQAKVSCPAASTTDISGDIASYQDAISSFQDAARSVVDALDVAHEYNQEYGIFYRNIGLYVVWGLAILCSILFVIGHVAQNVCLTQFAIFFGMLTYLLFIILGIIWLLLTSILADLCMDPSYNAVRSLPKGDLQDLGNFYVTCVGNNTLQDHMDEGWTELAKLNDTINSAKMACPNNNDLNNMQTTLGLIDVQYGDTRSNLDCPPLQSLWFQFINQGLCDETYTGLFYIWGSQLITSFFLFFLAVTASVVYQYYTAIKVAPGSEDDVENNQHSPRVVNKAPILVSAVPAPVNVSQESPKGSPRVEHEHHHAPPEVPAFQVHYDDPPQHHHHHDKHHHNF